MKASHRLNLLLLSICFFLQILKDCFRRLKGEDTTEDGEQNDGQLTCVLILVPLYTTHYLKPNVCQKCKKMAVFLKVKVKKEKVEIDKNQSWIFCRGRRNGRQNGRLGVAGRNDRRGKGKSIFLFQCKFYLIVCSSKTLHQ